MAEELNGKWNDVLDNDISDQVDFDVPDVEPSYGYEDPVETPHTDDEPKGDDIDGLVEEPTLETNTDVEPTEDIPVMHQFLKQYGIEDPSKIQFEDENGELSEVNFDSLTRDEQLTMLSELTNPGLSDHEIEVVNYLRKYNVTFDQVLDHFANERLNQYLSENPDKVKQKAYQIDDYSDDELYLADLKSKYPDFTDEELMSKLDVAKLNEELFKKESEVLRKQYKDQEDQAIELEKQQEAQRNQDLQDSLINAVNMFNNISIDDLDAADEEHMVLEVEDTEKHNILNYLLTQDKDGKSQLVKDIEDPAKLIEIAYFMLYGKSNMADITNYWKGVLKETRKEIKSQTPKPSKKDNTTVVSTPKKEEVDTFANQVSTVSGWDRYL